MLLTLLLACDGDADKITPVDDTGDSSIDSEAPAALDPEDLATLEAQIERTLARQRFATGASVAIWRDGEIVYARGFGSADPEAEVPVTPDTLFQIGSDTKKMTAVAVLQQVQAGALSLDTPLDVLLPGFALARSPDWASSATLHALLSHQGGLFDYTPWDDDPADAVLAERAMGIVAEREYAMAPAGSFWNYANPNFSLAGLAAETASGRAYADLLTEDLFAPLGMTHTFAREADLPSDAAVAIGNGYYYTSDRDWFDLWQSDGALARGSVHLANNADNGFTRPAGLVWSTATDNCNFAGFLIDGDPAVLDDALRASISTQHVNLYPSIDIQGYGYGLMVIQGFTDSDGAYHDAPMWLHGGNTLAQTSLFYVLPEQRMAVCVLSNGYGDDFSDVAIEAFSLFAALPEPTENPGFNTFEPDLSAMVGQYEDPGLGAIEVRMREGSLTISIPLLEEYGFTVGPSLTPYLNEIFQFNINGTGYTLTFVTEDGAESPTWAVNRAFVGTRVTHNSLTAAEGRLSRAQVEALLLNPAPTPPLPR